jgi:hypothetical protein
MIVLFVMLAIISAALIAPGWVIARRQNPQGPAIMFLALPGIILWTVLTASGVGAQSLSNIIEIFGIVVVSVIAAYAKLFIMDRREMKQSGIIALIIVLGITLLLRLFMPVIPE